MAMIDRKVEIAQKIRQTGRVGVAELAEEYGVSTMTIRRDLARLEQEGLVTVEYGGAILRQPSLLENDMLQKQTSFPEEKRRIAEAALAFVQDGDSVFVDGGTTACEVARLLPRRKDLQVMTNSLPAANILAACDTIRLTLCPGEYRALSMAFLGQLTDEFLSSFRFDVLFLGVEGVQDGIFVPNEGDGTTKRKLIGQANTVVCLADHSKFGQAFHYRIAGLEQVDHLITDSGLPEEQAALYREKTDLILA
ncbi:DeoR/GlpR family DNA-binding transcription regulator [Gemmiger sp.]